MRPYDPLIKYKEDHMQKPPSFYWGVVAGLIAWGFILYAVAKLI